MENQRSPHRLVIQHANLNPQPLAIEDGDALIGEYASFIFGTLYPSRPHEFDGLYMIPTFDEVLDLADRLSGERALTSPAKARVAVIPETKHPSYFQGLGLPLEPPLVEALVRHGLAGQDAPVVIQSFELSNLETLSGQVGARRLLLIDDLPLTVPGDTRTYGELLADLPALREKVDCLGVSRETIWGEDGPTSFLAEAQAAGLQVYVWTFRAEKPGASWNGDITQEIAAFLRLGVDGIFADQADLAVRARDSLASGGPGGPATPLAPPGAVGGP
jgi:glycerophosphoryl diester phosphodiesterase